MLYPLKTVQAKLRKIVVYNRFWRQLMQKRVESFRDSSLFEITLRDGTSYVEASMDYLNLRSEVPKQFVEQWKMMQTRRVTNRMFEMPLELIDQEQEERELEEYIQQYNERLQRKTRKSIKKPAILPS